MSFLLRLLICLVSVTAHAAVVRVDITDRSDIGKAGYEQLTGKLHFEIDPKLPQNAIIADVDLAPVNAAGKVSFVADLRLWKPKDATRSNGAAWVEIPNRGGKASLPTSMMEQGFTMLNVGWEFDVAADKLRLEVPRARNKDGSPIRGVVSAVFTPEKRADEQSITDLTDYPPVDIEGAESHLIVRYRAAYPEGQEVPRKLWSLQSGRIHLKGGFEPGKSYEVFYLAEAPRVAGLGYAAVRDAVAWLKHDPASPVKVKHAYAFGSSQCGRFLRDFVYLGFNTDEQNRMALDGVMSHVAGAGRLVLNQRWSTPRAVSGYYTASYPFADTSQIDPVSGHAEGILANARVKHAPKIFYTNMAAEYWGAGRVAALTHTSPDGTKDIALPENAFYMRREAHHKDDKAHTGQLAPKVNTSSHPGVIAMQVLAAELGVWILIGSIAPIESPEQSLPYNRSVLINADGDIAASYDKIHLFDVELANGESYNESTRVMPGNQAVLAYTPWGVCGLSVCYDLRFPTLYRDLALNGAQMLMVPAAFLDTTGKVHWHTLLKARAIETGCFVIAPAQCGEHPGGRKSYGHSLVVSPWGEVIADGGNTPGVVLATLNMADVAQARSRIPSLQHIKPYQLKTI
jgi:predicted amidohydrolase